MADSRPDVTHQVRLLPSGTTPPLPVEAGKHHELVVHVEGDEAPQAMTPEAAGAEGGVALPKLGEKFSVNPVMGSVTGSVVFPLIRLMNNRVYIPRGSSRLRRAVRWRGSM